DKTTLLDGITALKCLHNRLTDDQHYFPSSSSDAQFDSVYLPAKVKDVVAEWETSRQSEFCSHVNEFYVQSILYLEKWVKYTEEVEDMKLAWMTLDGPIDLNAVQFSLHKLASKDVQVFGHLNALQLESEHDQISSYVSSRV